MEVRGISDPPGNETIVVNGIEDQDYDLGAAVASIFGADLSVLLADTDGSESLTFKLSGFTANLLTFPPSFDTLGEVNYLGAAEGYELSPEALLQARLTPDPDYSGTNPPLYAGLTLRASSQEADGDVSFSNDFVLDFEIQPVVDGDGVTNLSPSINVVEGDLEDATFPNDFIPILQINAAANADSDGSEEVLFFDIDFTTIVNDAQIIEQLRILEGNPALPDPGLNAADDLLLAQIILSNYTRKTDANFTLDAGGFNGTIRVDPLGFGSATQGLALDNRLFVDSNVDFAIPYTVFVQDSATLSGGAVIVTTTQTGSFGINIAGTADVPILIAEDVAGAFITPLDLTFNFTDEDVALGRPLSESVELFVELQPPLGGNLSDYAFVDSFGEIVGLNAGGKCCKLVGWSVVSPLLLIFALLQMEPGSFPWLNSKLVSFS